MATVYLYSATNLVEGDFSFYFPVSYSGFGQYQQGYNTDIEYSSYSASASVNHITSIVSSIPGGGFGPFAFYGLNIPVPNTVQAAQLPSFLSQVGLATILAGNDTIYGSSIGNDTLVGYGTNNNIYAGSGNDIINVVSADIYEKGGNYDITGIGASNAIIIGGFGTNVVHGGDGSILDDGYDNNTLIALALGSHSITIANETGNDTIEFRDGTVPGHTVKATISNFIVGQDTIELTAGAQMLTSGDLSSITSHIANNGSGNAVLTLGAETITFVGVHAASLAASDFIIVA